MTTYLSTQNEACDERNVFVFFTSSKSTDNANISTYTGLNEQVHIEDNTLNVAEGDEPPPPPPQATIMEAFQHFACLYIKYVQIFKRLEMCYDAMVHPQKRIDVKVKTRCFF